MRIEKNKTKKSKQVKNKHSQKKALVDLFKLHSEERRRDMLYLWKKGDGFCLSRWAFYSEERGRVDFVLSRRECAWLLLSLQHQLRGKPIRVQPKTGTRKGQRVVSLKKNFGKMVGE